MRTYVIFCVCVEVKEAFIEEVSGNCAPLAVILYF